jgi:hypothetical protein
MSLIPELPPFLHWVEHLLFIFLFYHFLWTKIHPVRVVLRHASLVHIERFFVTISPFLERIYPILKESQAPLGRPPFDQAFQLRWFIWHLLFGEQTIELSLLKFNGWSELRDLLHCPKKTYYQSTLNRFLDRVGPVTLCKIHVALVLECLKLGLLKGMRLVIDGFPIPSYLSTQKCLKNPKLVIGECKEFFAQLPLLKLVGQLRAAGMTGHLLADCLRVFIFEVLWNMPSRTKAIKTIKEKEGLEAALEFPKRCPCVATYQKFVTALEALSRFGAIQKALIARVCSSPALAVKAGSLKAVKQFVQLRGLLSNSLPAKDSGTKLNYCASKKMTYWGRGGKILTDAESELPVLLGIQRDAAISEAEFTEFLQLFRASYGEAFPIEELVGDGEFAPEGYKEGTEKVLEVSLHSLEEEAGTKRKRLKPKWFKVRLTVERCISRLKCGFQVQAPRVMGERRVGAWVQLGGITKILCALAAGQWGRRDKIRSLRFIRGQSRDLIS